MLVVRQHTNLADIKLNVHIKIFLRSNYCNRRLAKAKAGSYHLGRRSKVKVSLFAGCGNIYSLLKDGKCTKKYGKATKYNMFILELEKYFDDNYNILH